MALAGLEKLCETHSLFYSMIDQRPNFKMVCKRPYLQIKCHEEKCDWKKKKTKNISSKNATSTKWNKEKYDILKESLAKENINLVGISSGKRKAILKKLVQTSENEHIGWCNSFKQFNDQMLMLNHCSHNRNN